MAHMKRIQFHAVNHKDSQHEFTKYTSFWTLSSIFLTKPVQQRCPTLLIPLCDLNKNSMWPRELRGRRKFWEQFLGRRQQLWRHPSWMGLMWAHSRILGQPVPLGFSSLCRHSSAQSWRFRLPVTPTAKPFYQTCGITSAPRFNSSQTIMFAISYISII